MVKEEEKNRKKTMTGGRKGFVKESRVGGKKEGFQREGGKRW